MIWLVFLLSTYSHAANFACLDAGKVKFEYNGKKIEEDSAYCFNKDKTKFMSQNCDDKKCLALSIDVCKINRSKVLRGKIGSPGFKLCRELGGSGQVMDFYDGKEWWDMDRCFFAKDESFLDTGSLLERYNKCFND